MPQHDSVKAFSFYMTILNNPQLHLHIKPHYLFYHRIHPYSFLSIFVLSLIGNPDFQTCRLHFATPEARRLADRRTGGEKTISEPFVRLIVNFPSHY